MKVLFVTQNIAPFRINWINELAKYVEIEVVHLNEYEKGFNRKLLQDLNPNIKVSDISKILLNKYRFFNKTELRKKSYDVLLLDGYGFLGQTVLIHYLRRKKIKFIMSIDGGILPYKEKFIKKCIKKYLLSAPGAFLSTAESTDQFIKNYNPKSVLYRHYFSSVYEKDIVSFDVRAQLHQQYRKQLGFSEKFVVLCVGRFIQLKGFDIILKSVKNAPENYLFVFVGGKPNEYYLSLINAEDRDKIVFVDIINHEILDKYYLASDVFAMPTREDVWGLVVGEAMAKGLPVVSSSMCNSAVAMIEKENGFIIDNESPERYLSAFMEIERNSDLAQKMSKQNICRMHEYAIDRAVKQDIQNLRDFFAKE